MHNYSPLIVALALGSIGGSKSHCVQDGLMTGFTGPPSVEQMKSDQVRISWKNQVEYRECADDFVVKYWMKNQTTFPGGMEYAISDLSCRRPLIDASCDSVDITVEPGIVYVFQAVAREARGPVVNSNYSPSIEFKTSAVIGMTVTSPFPENRHIAALKFISFQFNARSKE